MTDHPEPLTIIEPRMRRLTAYLAALWQYRGLLYFLTKRDVQVRYRQTLLGAAWAVIQPVFSMVIFSIFFGRLAGIKSDGIPYPIFVFAGLLPWTYFANAISASGGSLVASSRLVTKVYFPRLVIPTSAALGGLVDLAVAMIIYAALMTYYRFVPGPALLLFPVLVALTVACASGVGLWLSALNVRYRDVRYVTPFLVQAWLFLSPVIYPVSLVKPPYQWLLALNPMSGIIDAFRASLLGQSAVHWSTLGISTVVIALIFVTGLLYFRKTECVFADLV